MSYPEFMVWYKYRAKFGSLNQGMRIEVAVARLASFYGNCRAGKQVFDIHDFAPNLERPILTLEEAMASWA